MSANPVADNHELRIGVDTGGTFTDFVVYHPKSGSLETFKLPSTPENPARAVIEGLNNIFADRRYQSEAAACTIIHGSTVATNALLERKGARTALVTTRGFGDVIEIGRQNRPALYDLSARPPIPLVPAELRFEVHERVDYQGNILQPLNPDQVRQIVAELRRHQVDSVAVCLLFSFIMPEHEQIIGDQLRAEGIFYSLSCELLPEFREYERTSTTVVNAYVSPVLDRYLSNLDRAISRRETSRRLRIMQSNGGCLSPSEARKNGAHCILSGPAGGVIGGAYLASQTYHQPVGEPKRLITLDMGGTSTDISLIEDEPKLTTEAVIGGCPIRLPMMDVHTIGAGGGSIAYVDPGGALRVGPESAGADPGPACYGRGSSPTVTDANLVLGRLPADHFLGGKMKLYEDKAREALGRLAHQLGLTIEQTALGIIEVVNANMEGAIRVISVQRGHDPRQFCLLSFGGAGGLHAGDLARRVGIPRVLVPQMAGVFSAFGMLAADVVKDYSKTVMLSGHTAWEQIQAALRPMLERGLYEIHQEGIAPEAAHIETFADVRYRGQSFEITVPLRQTLVNDFHAAHQQLYGYQRPGASVEIVNLRLRLIGSVSKPQLIPEPGQHHQVSPTPPEYRRVILRSGPRPTPFYPAEAVLPGQVLPGPAIVMRDDTTILIEEGDQFHADAYGNLWIEVRP